MFIFLHCPIGHFLSFVEGVSSARGLCSTRLLFSMFVHCRVLGSAEYCSLFSLSFTSCMSKNAWAPCGPKCVWENLSPLLFLLVSSCLFQTPSHLFRRRGVLRRAFFFLAPHPVQGAVNILAFFFEYKSTCNLRRLQVRYSFIVSSTCTGKSLPVHMF